MKCSSKFENKFKGREVKRNIKNKIHVTLPNLCGPSGPTQTGRNLTMGREFWIFIVVYLQTF